MVLFHEAGNGLRVVACSRSATAAGVRRDMPLAEARTLMGDGRIDQHDPSADREALRELGEWCRRYTPSVALEPAAPAESLVLDTTGCDHLHGGERPMLVRIVDEFSRQGLSARAAVADTLGAAWAAAHFSGETAVVVGRGESVSTLSPLPVESLRLLPEIVGTLHELDLRTVGQLLALPRDSLRSRFDPLLLERIDQATGRVPEAVTFEHAPQPVVATWEFEHPVSERTWICVMLQRLVDDVASQLAERFLGTAELECRLLHGGQCRAVTVGLVRPTASGTHLWALLELKLERVPFGDEVSRLQVEATLLQPLRERQPTLIDSPGGFDEAADLIERLTSRLGEGAVLRPECADDHQPERAFRMRPAIRNKPIRDRLILTEPELTKPDPPSVRPPHTLSPHVRPPSVWREPCRVVAVSVVPDGPPVRFGWQGYEHQVVRSWGPERIETGWWRGGQIRRDYYRVETAQWRRFWLFRDRSTGEWFLQGSFD